MRVFSPSCSTNREICSYSGLYINTYTPRKYCCGAFWVNTDQRLSFLSSPLLMKNVFLSSLAGVSAEKPIKEKVKNRNVRDVLSTLSFIDHLFTEIINFSAPFP